MLDKHDVGNMISYIQEALETGLLRKGLIEVVIECKDNIESRRYESDISIEEINKLRMLIDVFLSKLGY